jgi:multidrug resistance efflux pump
MRRRLIFGGVVILTIVTSVLLFLSRKGGQPESIRTTGTVEGVEVNIAAAISGRISKQCCNEGDTIKEGDIVVELESDDLKASLEEALAGVEKAKADVTVSESAISASKANITNAEAEIGDAEADVEKTRVQMEEAKRHMDRLKALYEREIITRESFEIAVTDYETTVANHKSSKAKLIAARSGRDAALAQFRTAESQLSSAKANLEQSKAKLSYARAKLSEAIIKSPISGMVVFKALEKGEWASPGTTILTIVDLDNIYIRVDVEETMIDRIGLNGEAMIRTEGTPRRTFLGRIAEIGEYAGFATQRDVTSGRQDIKTFKVKIAVDDSGGFLKPGMTVAVEIPKRTSND